MSDGVLVDWQSRAYELDAFSASTGKQLWTQQTDGDAYEYQSTRGTAAYGEFIINSYSGYVYAFDLQTGKRLWKFYSGSSGFETPTGAWQLYNNPTIADG